MTNLASELTSAATLASFLTSNYANGPSTWSTYRISTIDAPRREIYDNMMPAFFVTNPAGDEIQDEATVVCPQVEANFDIIAVINDGDSRSDTAAINGVTLRETLIAVLRNFEGLGITSGLARLGVKSFEDDQGNNFPWLQITVNCVALYEPASA